MLIKKNKNGNYLFPILKYNNHSSYRHSGWALLGCGHEVWYDLYYSEKLPEYGKVYRYCWVCNQKIHPWKTITKGWTIKGHY